MPTARRTKPPLTQKQATSQTAEVDPTNAAPAKSAPPESSTGQSPVDLLPLPASKTAAGAAVEALSGGLSHPSSPSESPGRTSLIGLLNTPAGSATAGLASIFGLLLALAPFLGSSTVLMIVGVPLAIWGGYQLVLKGRNAATKWFAALGAILALMVVTFAVIRNAVQPRTTEFFYGGAPLVFSNDSPLSGETYPPLTLDPVEGWKFDSLLGPASLTVSCWRYGAYDGKGEIRWAKVVDGDFETLWVPLSTLGAMARGSALTVLPCSDWRWRIQEFPW